MILATEHDTYLQRHWKAVEAGLNMLILKLVLSCSSYVHVDVRRRYLISDSNVYDW